MPARLFVSAPLAPHCEFELPAGAARHVQVLRLQPGAALTIFDGRGGEWSAAVAAMGRSSVRVRIESFHAVERELAVHVTLALAMPANERMDNLIEKATEMGASVIQPLHCNRSVLRLAGERALKKVAHWQGVAIAACEQSGRTRVPGVAAVQDLADWLAALPACIDAAGLRLLLSPGGRPWHEVWPDTGAAGLHNLISLSGPEGGLTEDEEHAARSRGFQPASLGPRILRADTAPLVVLAHAALRADARPARAAA